MRPPIVVFFSTKYTLNPLSPKSIAVDNPAMPPPTTKAAGVTGTVLVGTSSKSLDRAIPALISSIAFLSAFFLTSGAW
jgi:hypothetical protein